MKATFNEVYKKVLKNGTNVEDPHVSPKLLKMFAPSKCNQVELLVHGSGKTADDVKYKGEGAITVISTDVTFPMFNPAELEFLAEYAAAMSPVAKETNISQAEANAQNTNNQPTEHQA
ncbi:hypothetical protein AMELA_G00027950 [Ameiurus melas]|uniref:Uncharacterized protein n=1 Tax=Ameiurus melas TaxID=219545 RepID=A0A7J6BEE4_AMEME|nr:hypothetical protein AMELA_G00027950 [Ameiurus melas]